MQVFRPADVDLATAPDANPAFGAPTGTDLPVMRSVVRLASSEGGLRSGIWDAAAGTAEFVHSADEWAYILEGEVQVTAAGATHQLRAGDVFYTPAGEHMTWVIPTYVRKVWVHRRPPLPGRVKRKLMKLARQVRRSSASP
jgi:uncharacterized cupin superfamily protein